MRSTRGSGSRVSEGRSMRKRVALIGFGIAVAGIIVVSSAALQAHHAFAAEFDARKEVTLKGAVTRVEWVNPHVWIHVDVKKPDGKVESWAIEAGTPNVLFRRGVTKQSLTPGLEIVVDGYQAKDASHRAN